ncbi:hypothetical protein [Flexivirga sp. B27]
MSAPGRMSRGRRWPWVAAAVVVVLVVALVATVVGRSAEGKDSVRVGERLDAQTVFAGQETDTTKLSVPVAFGALSVTVETAPEIGEREHRTRAPDGAMIVQVSWAPSVYEQASPVWPTADARERQDPGARLTLVTGGHRYPIGSAVTIAGDGASAIVVVRGDGSDARIESRFAGRTFRSSAGPSTPRVAQRETDSACEDTPDKTYVSVTCSLPVHRGHYVAGLGAAPSGKEWLIVSSAAATRREDAVRRYAAGNRHAEYVRSGAPSVSVTVDGVTARPRVAGSDTMVAASVKVADRAWLVDADRPSTVRLRYRLPTKIDRARSDWSGAPATYQVDVSTTTTVPAG